MRRTLQQALSEEQPLQIVGTLNVYVAIMAKQVGYRAIYLSGAAVANFCHGLPDIGVTTLAQVVEETKKITEMVDLPLLVDIDTGWGTIANSIKAMINAGAAAIHIEDQRQQKKCGHLEMKSVIPKEEMCDRIKAAVDARSDKNFLIMARTDAFGIEGLNGTIERLQAYCEAGADLCFPEAIPSLKDYVMIRNVIHKPLLANLTEFGKTPLFTLEELQKIGIEMALYPVSVSRVMNAAALKALQHIRKAKSQKELLPLMQTREELYDFLNYRP